MAIKKSILAFAIFGSVSAYASLGITPPEGSDVWITTDADAQHLVTQHGATVFIRLLLVLLLQIGF